MSKYNVGDKFVIEIKEIDKLGNHMISDDAGIGIRLLDKLDALDGDYVNEHFGDIQDEAYKKGLSDAWELARKIRNMTFEKARCVFGLDINNKTGADLQKEIFALDIQEVIGRLETYEKEQAEIKVGDVVKQITIDSTPIIVTKINENDRTFSGIDARGVTYSCRYLIDYVKIGEHIDIQSILQQIGGKQE